jgi:hypothetical protein
MKAMVLLKESDQPNSLSALNGLSVRALIPDGSLDEPGTCTLSDALPLCPSLVAVMLAVPTAIAVTRPDAETVANAMLSELHVITRPVRMLLFASRVVAVACVVNPGFREPVLSVTLTDATGAAVMVSVALPVCPSQPAMICTVPTAIALTRPEVDTVATPVLLELQVIARPVSTLLFASRVVAVAWVV